MISTNEPELPCAGQAMEGDDPNGPPAEGAVQSQDIPAIRGVSQ